MDSLSPWFQISGVYNKWRFSFKWNLLFLLLFLSVSINAQVVINEVVTDPQTDWSTNDFDGTDGGGTVSQGTDEWIELYITSNGLDLTNWTIEVTDGGFFSGDLTSRDVTGTGAFQTSVYSGAGSFTNTQAGDYLVLGNPQSSENMTNDVYIVLRNASATLIDDVEIGDDPESDGNGDGAPDGSASGGNATGVDDESVARIANGTDTGNDVNDFQQTRSTMGSENGLTTTFVDASATDDEGLGTVGDPKQSIQSGVDMALTGGTVTVVSGTYSESLTLSKSLTLNGANQGVAGNGTRGAESVIDPSSDNVGVTVSANDITIDGFQFGTNSSTSNITNGIVSTSNTGVTISNNILYGNGLGVSVTGGSSGAITVSNNLISMLALEDALNATTGSVGIYAAAMSGTVDVNLTNNDISNAAVGVSTYSLTSSTALVIDGGAYTGCTAGVIPANTDGGGGFSPSTLTIQNLTMSGFATDTDVINPDTETGVYVFNGGGTSADDITVSIINLDVSGVGNDASNYSGIVIGDFPTSTDGAEINATITNCNIHDNENRGIFVRGEDATATITQCSIIGNGFNPTATGGNPGFSVISNQGGSATVTNSYVTNPASLSAPEDIPNDYYTAGMHMSTGGTLTASNCNFNQNGNGLIAETTGIDLSGNYFGSTTEATILSYVSANNDFSPWLGSGTDTDGGTAGFQGDFSDLHIGTSGSQTTNFFQEAHDLLTSGGTLTVNTGSYSESLTATQDITLSPAAGTSIDNLTLNGGNATVTADLTINNTLTLTSGILDIDPDDGDRSDDPVLILSNAVSGTFSASNHIEGKVQVAIGAASSYTFPVGDIGTYRPVIVSPTNATTFTVSHIWDFAPTGGGAIPTLDDLIGETSTTPSGTIQSTLDYKYWTVDVSGSPGATDLTLQVESADDLTDPTTIGITRFDGSTWSVLNQTSNGGSDPYTITTQTSSFSDFSIYSTNATNNPLPVELIDFIGEVHETGRVNLKWSTALEINSDYFQVERKIGTQDEFAIVGRVESNGNSSSRIDYEFEDRSTSLAPMYYRLKMVDFDGTYEFSKIIVLIPNIYGKELTIYPNPSSGSITLQGLDPSYVKEVRFYDLTGRLRKSLGQIDSNQWLVNDLSSGHYVLHVELVDGKLFKGEIVVED